MIWQCHIWMGQRLRFLECPGHYWKQRWPWMISDPVLRPALTGMTFLTTSLLTDSHICVASSSHILQAGIMATNTRNFACAVCTGHNASPHHVLILLDETSICICHNGTSHQLFTSHCSACPLPPLSLREMLLHFFFIIRLVISTYRHYYNSGQQFVLKTVISTKYSVYQEYQGSYCVRWTQAGLASLNTAATQRWPQMNKEPKFQCHNNSSANKQNSLRRAYMSTLPCIANINGVHIVTPWTLIALYFLKFNSSCILKVFHTLRALHGCVVLDLN